MKKTRPKKSKVEPGKPGDTEDDLAAFRSVSEAELQLLQSRHQEQRAKAALAGGAQEARARGAAQRGSVRPRNGWWWFRYRGAPDETGHRHEHATRIARLDNMTYVDARAAGDALADELLPLEGLACFWSTWCKTFLDDYVPLMKSGTREVTTSIVNTHLKGAFMRQRLNEIRRLHVQAWVSHMSGAGAAPDSVRLRYSILLKMLRRAQLDGYTVDLPAPGSIQLPQSDRVENPSLAPYTGDELERLLDAAPEPLRTIVRLCAFVNLRIGEALGLKVEDIDLAGGRLTLTRQSNRGRIKRPKTKRSAGEHRLGPALIAQLRAYLAMHPREGYLFPSPRRPGYPLHETGVRRKLNALLEELDLKVHGRAFHGARRWFGTSGARAGVAPQALQKAMRHRDARSTQRYVRLDTSDADQAIERVEAEYYRTRKHRVTRLVKRNPAKGSKSE